MRALVTGGLGFIGRHLVKRLLDQGYAVEIVDDFSNIHKHDGELPSVVSEMLRHPKAQLHYMTVKKFRTETRYTAIYHLASPVGPAGVLNYAGKMGQMIVSDAYKMAEMAMKLKVPLFAVSTSEVYGCDPQDVPQVEDLPKIVPSNTTVRLEYGVAKLLTEISLSNLVASGLRVAMIRPYNTVGPGQNGDAGFVLPRFVSQALKGEPLTVFGSGSQVRTFTSVNDLVESIFVVMNAKRWGEVYNVGNPQNICTIKGLADKVIELSGSSSQVELRDPKTIYGNKYEEAWNKIPNIDKIKSIGWTPKESLDDIIKQTIAAQRAA